MYIIKIDNVYEKYTSTIRWYGGDLRTTNNISEAKLISRKGDAKERAQVIRLCWMEYPRLRNKWRKKFGWENSIIVQVKEVKSGKESQ